MAFHVGQKVVCVDASWVGAPYWLRHVPNRPTEGGRYIIRGFRSNGGLLLEELRNPIRLWTDGFDEGGFKSHRFRPVIERKTDISIFTAMLTSNRILENQT